MRGRRTRNPQSSRTLVASQRDPSVSYNTRCVVLHVRAVRQLRLVPIADAAPPEVEAQRRQRTGDRAPCTGLLPRAPLQSIFLRKKNTQRLMSRDRTAKQQSALCGDPSRGSFDCAISNPPLLRSNPADSSCNELLPARKLQKPI